MMPEKLTDVILGDFPKPNDERWQEIEQERRIRRMIQAGVIKQDQGNEPGANPLHVVAVVALIVIALVAFLAAGGTGDLETKRVEVMSR